MGRAGCPQSWTPSGPEHPPAVEDKDAGLIFWEGCALVSKLQRKADQILIARKHLSRQSPRDIS